MIKPGARVIVKPSPASRKDYPAAMRGTVRRVTGGGMYEVELDEPVTLRFRPLCDSRLEPADHEITRYFAHPETTYLESDLG